MRLRPALAPLAVTAALGLGLLTSCTAGDAHHGDTAGAASAGAGMPFDDADVSFLQAMIPHHEQAITMAETALDPASGAGTAVVELARRVRDGQEPEIATMQGWLQGWNRPLQPPETTGHDMAGHTMGNGQSMGNGPAMDNGHDMTGMMSDDDLARLGRVRGDAFDRLWLELMVEHHRGAIAMAETVKAAGTNPAVHQLADRIIAAQQAEVDAMARMLG